ncbi:Glycerophosphocholine phosphodiesterase [Kalmusia sp. IMI 367209]|nr:Glycerophosphocholine phosphodiesterase [Kalmusia sp. IMI 367209]
MRFGRSLYEHRVAGWGSNYIDYYGLKKALKLAIRDAAGQSGVDLTDFNAALESEVSKVQEFYSGRLSSLRQCFDTEIRRSTLVDTDRPSAFSLDPHEHVAAIAACLRYRLDIGRLMWYGRVNAEGLRYLARKLQRVSPDATYHTTPSSPDDDFSSQRATLKELEAIDRLISALKYSQKWAKDSSPLERLGFQLSAMAETDVIHAALRQDDKEGVRRSLIAANLPKPLLLAVLQEAALQGARNCVQMLLKLIGHSLQDETFGIRRNVLHILVLTASNERTLREDVHNIERYEDMLAPLSDKATDYTSKLLLVLETMHEAQRLAVLQKDYRGRCPLHYAAESGLTHMCEVILQFIREWGIQFRPQEIGSLDDHDGNSPLHLSVINRNESVTRVFLSSAEMIQFSLGPTKSLGDALGGLLHIALQQETTSIVEALLATRLVNLDYRPSTGETALFIASRAGSFEYIKMLTTSSQQLDLNRRGSSYGWTPLIVGCIYDRLDAVKLLLDLGADEGLVDDFGWSALDHVAFRGHWDLSRLLQQTISKSNFRVPKLPLPSTNALPPLPPSTTRIFVNIGPLNTRKSHSAVDLSPHLSDFPFNPHPTVRYSIATKGLGVEGPGGVMELPVLDDTTNYPYVFETTNPKDARLVFQLLQKKSDSESPVHIGTSVALLEELGNSLGPDRESLFRDHILPIIGCNNYQFLGTITINFLLARPFPDPRRSPSLVIDEEVWNSNGLGMNSPAFKRLQIGENTIQSFKSTIDLGVSYLECDVQLTRDHVPVIYHDFLVSESGADIAPMNLSFDQFMCIGDMQRPMNKDLGDCPPVSDNKGFAAHVYHSPNSLRQRSVSFDACEDYRTRDFLTRIKHTHEFKVKGFKGNVRGMHIHESFATLDQLLRSLPEEVALDIELKYPMLWEAEDWKMDLYGVEFNLYTDKTLEKIYQHGGNRALLFTSFSPELCILAAHKQDTYPVMFLNESNLFPTGDNRASNLQEAIHFARHWGLPGIVMSSEPFVASPKLVRFVQDAGLMCTSFGMPNNDPKNAKVQADEGIDAIIVDSVALINHSFKENMGAMAENDV